MNNILQISGLGKRYRRTWALQDCTLELPAGQVAALVGPNGAGKTTLLHLIVGLLQPTAGSIQVFGNSPHTHFSTVFPRLGFVAQDHPLYRDFTVEDLLTFGHKLNPHWDAQLARARVQKLAIPFKKRAGQLSGGQQAQVALILALAKRPDLLVLDEPLASLDPLARREWLGMLMEAVAETGMSVLLSSHIIGELERVCDHLIILSASRVQLTGAIPEIVSEHKRLVGVRQNEAAIASLHTIIEASHTERQSTLFIRATGQVFAPSWDVQPVSLEDMVLAYLSRQNAEKLQSSPTSGVENRKMEVSK